MEETDTITEDTIDISDETFPAPELREMSGPRHLSDSQSRALKRLSDLFALHNEVEHGGIKVRTHALLVGPSGSGKTSLVRRLGDQENLPGYFIAAGSWIVAGARRGQESLLALRAFVRSIPEGNKGLICIDEIDKIVPHGDKMFAEAWTLSVFSEVISLLDADGKLQACAWTDDDIRRLKTAVFIVGCGTWHDLLKHETARSKNPDYDLIVRLDAGIPEEILFRFAKMVELTPPTLRDFAISVRRVRSELGLKQLSAAEESLLVDEIEDSGLGMRALESMLVDLLIANPKLQRKAEPVKAASSDAFGTEMATMTQNDQEWKLREMMDLISRLRLPVSQLRTKLTIRLAALKLSGVPDPLFSADALGTTVKHLGMFSVAMDFDTCVLKDLRRRREQELVLSGKAVHQVLSDWLSDRPFGLQEVGLLDCIIKVQAWASRLVGIVELVTKLAVYEKD